jgi:maltooligosyltrehalose synthase
LLDDGPGGLEARLSGVPALCARAEAGADAAIKLYVLARTLRLRRDWRPFGVAAEYVPLEVRGPHAGHALAFARRLEERWLLVAVTRLPAGLEAARAPWHDTHLVLPAGLDVPLRDLLAGTDATPLRGERGAILPLQDVFATLPVAVLAPIATH